MIARVVVKPTEVLVQAEDDTGFRFSDLSVDFHRDATTITIEKVRLIVSGNLVGLQINGEQIGSWPIDSREIMSVDENAPAAQTRSGARQRKRGSDAR